MPRREVRVIPASQLTPDYVGEVLETEYPEGSGYQQIVGYSVTKDGVHVDLGGRLGTRFFGNDKSLHIHAECP